MNYIKPEDIKEYVGKTPEGIAGMSEELAAMVNHFAELIVRECADIADNQEDYLTAKIIKQHFGVE